MAQSRKLAKLNRAVREVVGTQVLFRIRDPRVRGVTVLDADVAPDGRTAKVYVSILGDAAAEDRALEGLESAKGFFQAKIAERLETRYTPVLTFVADGGVKRSIEVSRTLKATTGRDLSLPDPPAPEPFEFKDSMLPDPTAPMEPPPPAPGDDDAFVPPPAVARPPAGPPPANRPPAAAPPAP